MPSTTSLSLDADFAVELTPHSFVVAPFVRLAWSEGLCRLVADSWTTAQHMGVLDEVSIAGSRVLGYSMAERLLRLDGALCAVRLNERHLAVRVAASDELIAERVIAWLRGRFPPPEREEDVPVTFWWWHQTARQTARMLPTPAWRDVAVNYASATGAAVGELAGWGGSPPEGGRLLLWHGAPGTGKTSAIRSLAGEWRDWANFHFITDPEEFLRNPGYLMEAVGPGIAVEGKRAQWRVLVLEDAGEYLALDAKQIQGQALSRLLNVCDGVLGQATRVLVLVTTNEPIQSLHPALARPGRCLSQICFEAFDAAGARAWCATHQVEAPPNRISTLADLFAVLHGRGAGPTTGPSFGFADAA